MVYACLWKYLRKALRFLWGVPNITYSRVITLLSGSAPLSTQLKARFVTFVYKAIHDLFYNKSCI